MYKYASGNDVCKGDEVLYSGLVWSVFKGNRGKYSRNPQITLIWLGNEASPLMSNVQFQHRKSTASKNLQVEFNKAPSNGAEASSSADLRAKEEEKPIKSKAIKHEVAKAKPTTGAADCQAKEAKPLESVNPSAGKAQAQAAVGPNALEDSKEEASPDNKGHEPTEEQAKLGEAAITINANNKGEAILEPTANQEEKENEEEVQQQTANPSHSAVEEKEPTLKELEELQLLLQAFATLRTPNVRDAIAKRTAKYFPLMK